MTTINEKFNRSIKLANIVKIRSVCRDERMAMDRPMRVEIGWELTNQRPGNGKVDGP